MKLDPFVVGDTYEHGVFRGQITRERPEPITRHEAEVLVHKLKGQGRIFAHEERSIRDLMVNEVVLVFENPDTFDKTFLSIDREPLA